nr:hypothetical protein [uncultured Desulfobacter sp.]
MTIKGTGNTICTKVKNSAGDFVCHKTEQDPFVLVDTLIKKVPRLVRHLMPITAGLFGYFAYDLKDKIEDLPKTCVGNSLPDICLYAPSAILIQDRKNCENRLCLPVFDRDRGQKDVLAREKLS